LKEASDHDLSSAHENQVGVVVSISGGQAGSIGWIYLRIEGQSAGMGKATQGNKLPLEYGSE
jgi:hypothetical protein